MLSKRLANIYITPDLISNIVTGGWNNVGAYIECTHGIPKDATIVSSAKSEEKDAFCILYEHESFSEVLDGDEIPTIEIKYRREML